MSCLPEFKRGENMRPRSNIHDWPLQVEPGSQAALQRHIDLREAILRYTREPDVIDCHKRYHDLHTSGYFFLIGHRVYLEGLEQFLRKEGILESDELLPKWDPSDSDPKRRDIPDEFIDPSKGEGHKVWPPLRPLLAVSFFPFKGPWLRLWPPFPIFLETQRRPGCPIPLPVWMPWRSLYGFVLAWTAHFLGHVLVGGKFAQIPNTSETPLFWLWHAFIDDLYFDWEQVHAHEHEHKHLASPAPHADSVSSHESHVHH